jgi:Divergent InlB B-repeat domain
MSTTLTDQVINVAIDGDVSGQIAVGHHIVQVVADHGAIVNVAAPEEKVVPRLRPGPARLLPRPFPGLLGREAEVAAASSSLGSGEPVEFYAETGWGKSALLRHLAHEPGTSAPGGIIASRSPGEPVEDVLQFLFEALYETDAPFKPTRAELRQYLRDPEPLVVLDDVDLPREDLQALMDAAPRARLLLATAERSLWGEGSALALGGLDEDAGVALIARELGRALAPEEIELARSLTRSLDGHPLRLVQAAALVASERRSLADLAATAASAAPGPSIAAEAMDSLDEPERVIAGMLGGLGGVSLDADLVSSLTGIAPAKAVLDPLCRRGVTEETEDGRYRSARLEVTDTDEDDPSTWKRRLVALLPLWLEEHGDDGAEVLGEVELLRAAVEWAAEDRDWDAVVTLGTRAAPWLLLTARWGSWERVVRRVLEAARMLEDRAGEAWALNELAIHRALWGQDRDTAVAMLTEASQLWRSIDRETDARIADHNRAVLLNVPPPPPPPPSHRKQPPFPWRRLIVGALLAVSAALIGWFLWKPGGTETLGITLSVDGGGIVGTTPSGIDCPDDCDEHFASGTRVTFTAIAGEGWVLAGWTGACAETPPAEPCVLDLTSDATVGANFERAPPPIGPTLTVEIVGRGTVTSVPPGISCPPECFHELPSGTRVTLTATPADGSRLALWEGMCEKTAITQPCVLRPRSDETAIARFEERAGPVGPTLTVNVVGNGTVTIVEPMGTACRTICTDNFRSEMDLVLRADPDEGWEPASWGGACADTAATKPCDLHLTNTDESVTATFRRVESAAEWSVGVTVAGGGDVTSVPRGIDCPGTCSASFPDVTNVTLTATPHVGWDVAGWAGACSDFEATSPCTLDLTHNVSVSARFERIKWNLSVSVEGQGAITSDPFGIECRDNCTEPFADGTRVRLYAEADPGWTFSSWGGACANTPASQPCNVEATSNLSIGAFFERIFWNLHVDVSGTGGGTVTSNPSGIGCSNACSAQYADGTQVTLYADADAGSSFVDWGGACDAFSSNKPCVLEIRDALTVTAEFRTTIY